jgi:trans-2,3-dihydro-3-hydroxyanthranilate isomerase
MRAHIVDVFAEQRYAGNPLAVVLGADAISEETMLRIAAEFNFSETTFVRSTPERDGAYPTRIYTPAGEIAFAGHPILGTAWVIRRFIAPGPAVRLALRVGEVRVSFEASEAGEAAWFEAPAISPGRRCPSEAIAAALGIASRDIDPNLPVQEMSAGTAALIVPLRSLDALRRARLDLAAFSPLAAEGFPRLVYLFCPETRRRENQLSARFFFDAHGVREDPATGNGAAFLGRYLLEHRYLSGADLSLRIEQGHEVRRPSLVMLHARRMGEGHSIRVGGAVVPILEGELR